MSLKYAILGLLSFKSQTGYELKANFDQSIRYLWNADQAQIYRTLAEISKEGLVVSEEIQQTGRPNKRVYELTQAGEEDLRQWLCLPVQAKEQRNAELVQVFFSGGISDEEILTNFKRLRDKIKADMESLSSLETRSGLFSSENQSPRSRFFFNCTLELGIRTAALNLEWINEVIEKIENGELPKREEKK